MAQSESEFSGSGSPEPFGHIDGSYTATSDEAVPASSLGAKHRAVMDMDTGGGYRAAAGVVPPVGKDGTGTGTGGIPAQPKTSSPGPDSELMACALHERILSDFIRPSRAMLEHRAAFISSHSPPGLQGPRDLLQQRVVAMGLAKKVHVSDHHQGAYIEAQYQQCFRLVARALARQLHNARTTRILSGVKSDVYERMAVEEFELSPLKRHNPPFECNSVPAIKLPIDQPRLPPLGSLLRHLVDAPVGQGASYLGGVQGDTETPGTAEREGGRETDAKRGQVVPPLPTETSRPNVVFLPTLVETQAAVYPGKYLECRHRPGGLEVSHACARLDLSRVQSIYKYMQDEDSLRGLGSLGDVIEGEDGTETVAATDETQTPAEAANASAGGSTGGSGSGSGVSAESGAPPASRGTVPYGDKEWMQRQRAFMEELEERYTEEVECEADREDRRQSMSVCGHWVLDKVVSLMAQCEVDKAR
ncbi:hypothetical protein KIPB_006861, partial [Kipferlia bialata]|eukprot:g6861.t1